MRNYFVNVYWEELVCLGREGWGGDDYVWGRQFTPMESHKRRTLEKAERFRDELNSRLRIRYEDAYSKDVSSVLSEGRPHVRIGSRRAIRGQNYARCV
jgi:hypothetical protein